MGISFDTRQAIYRALDDRVLDADGNPVTDAAGDVVTNSAPIWVDSQSRESDRVTDAAGDLVTDALGQYIYTTNQLRVAPIYDVKPQDTDPAVPQLYCVIGRLISSEQDTKTTKGLSATRRIYTHSRSNSEKQIEDVQDAIYDALHLQDLPLPGTAYCWRLARDGSEIDIGPDGRFFGVCVYRFEIANI